MTVKTCSRCSSSIKSSKKSTPLPLHPHKANRGAAFLKSACALASVCLCPSLASSQDIEYRTLPELIANGTESLARRDFPSAAASFNAILLNYREEPVWTETDLPSKILPLAGLASHKANLHAAAIDALSEYLATAPINRETALFAQYTLALSHLERDETEAAQLLFSELRSQAGNTPFRDLSLLREAQSSPLETAVDLLESLLDSPASQRLATIAKLELARIFLENEEPIKASFQILDTATIDQGYFELASRSFLAAQIAEQLESQNPHIALRCYQAVVPKLQLQEKLEGQIEEIRHTVRQLAPRLRTEQSMWIDHYQTSIAKLENQLDALKNSPDYNDAIALRKARCFAKIDRPLEAWILLESLVIQESALARNAHLDWISVARSLHAWSASATIARAFISKYPDDEYVPQTLFWIALSLLDRERYAEAFESFEAVLNTNPSRSLAASCHYYQGFCLYQSNERPEAIEAFAQAIQTQPNSPLAAQAYIWQGICHFASFDLEAARSAFDTVLAEPSFHPFHPEAAYRKAAAFYASGGLTASKRELEAWLENYPPHEREAEAYLLFGDTLFELSETTNAIAAYQKAETADPILRHSAALKQAACYLFTQAPQDSLSCLNAFEASFEIPASFATEHYLLKIDALDELKQSDKIPLALEAAIDTFGNDLEASRILSLITHRNPNRESSFEALSKTALERGQPTLAARYCVASIELAREEGNLSKAKRLALTLASDFNQDELPPEALIAAGNALREIGSLQTASYYRSIVEKFPDSEYRDAALYGLAILATKDDAPQLALTHLASITLPDAKSDTLKLELEVELGNLDAARQTAISILSQKRYSPKSKATALLQLGNLELRGNNPTQAYAYFQRVFTLYRGERDAVATAYLSCSQILYSKNRYVDCRNVLNEFLTQDDLRPFPSYAVATRLIAKLPLPEPQTAAAE